MARTRTKAAALKSVKAKAATVSRFMNSPVGTKVIRMLELEFPGGVGKDPYDTYKNLGNREVIDYLHALQRIDNKEDHENEA